MSMHEFLTILQKNIFQMLDVYSRSKSRSRLNNTALVDSMVDFTVYSHISAHAQEPYILIGDALLKQINYYKCQCYKYITAINVYSDYYSNQQCLSISEGIIHLINGRNINLNLNNFNQENKENNKDYTSNIYTPNINQRLNKLPDISSDISEDNDLKMWRVSKIRASTINIKKGRSWNGDKLSWNSTIQVEFYIINDNDMSKNSDNNNLNIDIAWYYDNLNQIK